MAEGESVSNWPPSVTFNDNDPKDGYASIYLKVPGMVVKGRGSIHKKAKNVAVESNFQNKIIEVRISFTEVGNSTVFEYKKNAPASGIDPKKCEILFNNSERVIIKVKKEKSESWASDERYLIKKPEEKLNNLQSN